MKKLNFGYSTLGCPRANWEEIVDTASRSGLSGIELRILNGRKDLAGAMDGVFGDPRSMAAAVDAAGARIVALDSSLCILGQEGWSEVTELARWADALRVPWIRVFDGGENGNFPLEARRGFVTRMKEWTELRGRLGMASDIMIETHSSLTRPEDCLELASELQAEGIRLNLLWDVFHTWKMGGRDLSETWKILKPWVRHIHVKDGTEGGEKLTLPGEGAVPMKGFLRLLQRDGFEGPVNLEWEAYWNPALPPLEDAISSGRRAGWW